MNLEAKDGDRQPRADLQFFGRIMANVSHEFNNVITIIGELSGLLEDLAGLAERGRPLPVAKLEQVTEKITQHAQRGKELVSHMNRFSHGVDENVGPVDLREIVDNLRVLTHRLLERREATLVYSAPEEEVRFTCNTVLFQRALFCGWELAMDEAGPSPELDFVLKPEYNGVDILISSDRGGDGLTSRGKWEELAEITGRLGGRVHCDRIETGFTIRLNLPADPEADA